MGDVGVSFTLRCICCVAVDEFGVEKSTDYKYFRSTGTTSCSVFKETLCDVNSIIEPVRPESWPLETMMVSLSLSSLCFSITVDT